MKPKILAIVILLALLVPTGLLAQDEVEVTIEKLAETVQAMQADFTIFARELGRVNARVDSVEERIEALEASETEAAIGTGEPCLIVSAAPGSFSMLGNQLRPETLNAYLNKLGSPPESMSVKYVRYIPQEDILEVRYESMGWGDDDTGIIERWRQCEFLGFEFDLD